MKICLEIFGIVELLKIAPRCHSASICRESPLYSPWILSPASAWSRAPPRRRLWFHSLFQAASQLSPARLENPKRGIGFSEVGATSRIHFTQIKIVNFKRLQLGESRREPELNSRSPSSSPHRSLPTKQCSSLSPSSVFNPPNNPPRS